MALSLLLDVVKDAARGRRLQRICSARLHNLGDMPYSSPSRPWLGTARLTEGRLQGALRPYYMPVSAL